MIKSPTDGSKRNFWLTPNGLAALGLIGAVTYFLLTEHRAHFIYALPFLIFLLCPLMLLRPSPSTSKKYEEVTHVACDVTAQMFSMKRVGFRQSSA